MQQTIVLLVVAACALQAGWVLMPTAWRRAFARRLLQRWPQAARWQPLRRAAGAAAGCGGCAGGDGGSCAPARDAAVPIRVMRR